MHSDWIKSLVLLASAVAAGCTADNDKSDMQKRQDAAVKDPFSYGPELGRAGTPGKPIQEPEPKKRDESLKGEWDRFWNP